MYKVYADGKLLHNDRVSLRLANAKLALELGKSGMFEFTIFQDHKRYADIKPLKTIIEVQRHNKTIFRGRVLDIEYGFHNEKHVTCEGELAFLLDSIIEPHAIVTSFSEYLDHVIELHNMQVETAKQFKRGNVTVADFEPYEVVEDYEYLTSLETLNKRMVEYSGGFLQVRHDEYGDMYLDLIAPDMNIANVSAQQIKLGKNLLDIKRETKGSDVFSGIIPLGAKIGDSERRLNISQTTGGSYYITNDEAVAAYGKIFKVVIFENITDGLTLLGEAHAYLAKNFAAVNSIEITAADLSGNNPELDSFEIGQWVELVSNAHFDEKQTFLIRKMTINLSNPASTKIEVGRTQQGIIESLGYASESIKGVSSRVSVLAEKVNSTEAKANNAETKANNAATAVTSVSNRVTVLEKVQPYVIETGTTGIFSWQKFSDNTCEFFGKVPVTNYAISTALGGWYRGANIYEATTYAYPFAMTEAPAVEMTFQTRNGLAAIAWVFSPDADTAQSYLPQCYLIRPITATGIYGNINIIGKGKLK